MSLSPIAFQNAVRLLGRAPVTAEDFRVVTVRAMNEITEMKKEIETLNKQK